MGDKRIRERAGDNEFMIKGKPDNTRPDANRQVPVASPKITEGSTAPNNTKSLKGIGGQIGKIDSNASTNNIPTNDWQTIQDNQTRRNKKPYS